MHVLSNDKVALVYSEKVDIHDMKSLEPIKSFVFKKSLDEIKAALKGEFKTTPDDNEIIKKFNRDTTQLIAGKNVAVLIDAIMINRHEKEFVSILSIIYLDNFEAYSIELIGKINCAIVLENSNRLLLGGDILTIWEKTVSGFKKINSEIIELITLPDECFSIAYGKKVVTYNKEMQVLSTFEIDREIKQLKYLKDNEILFTHSNNKLFIADYKTGHIILQLQLLNRIFWNIITNDGYFLVFCTYGRFFFISLPDFYYFYSYFKSPENFNSYSDDVKVENNYFISKSYEFSAETFLISNYMGPSDNKN